MKSYPSIPKAHSAPYPVYAFDKLDGSNIRAEWTRKKGFHKFGTRARLLGSDEPILGQSIPLIMEKYSVELEKRCVSKKAERVTFFFEFFGPNSFAGYHDENDTFDVVLFDVDVYKQGLMVPQDFLKFTDGLHTPSLLYHGNVTNDFVYQVQSGTLPGMTFEGVVCKWRLQKNSSRSNMLKIKSQAWLERLREDCAGDMNKFEQLS